ncbi:MAG: WD40/YVTN/BNR-like repeat-containing protein, partial [Gemmata sp.]
AYVAAVGHLWGPNPERGLFKTTDGGKTWAKSKFIDPSTGFVDVQLDPSDPDTVYAAAWPVRRDPFSGGSPRAQTGASGGLFKSADGGKTWEKLKGGLPENGYGRCGLAVYRKDPNVVFAIVQTADTAGATSNVGQPATVTNKDGNFAPGKVETGGVFRSEDKGRTWKKINDLVPRPFYYGQIRVDPNDDKRLYVLGVSLQASADGGQKFSAIGQPIHADHHALWVNPKDSKHILVGNDGGLYQSKDGGATFTANRGPVISQFYGVAVDTRTPYRVYGGLQDNGTWGGPTATHHPDGVTLADWRRLLGADGFQAAVDPTDPYTVYGESQYGGLSRINLRGAKGANTKSIRPAAPKGGAPNRYNWNAPILLSPHHPRTLYYGAQHVYKSTNRGDTWDKISADLTSPPKEGPIASGHTVLALAESPVKAGVLWAGTDDGNLWVSKNDGKDWTDLSAKLPGPKGRAVAKIECSRFDPAAAFVAVDRHRNDDFKPYIYATTDHGETWNLISTPLPPGAVVGVVRQSSKDKALLFAGTELGLYVTFDAGAKWSHVAKSGLPAHVRVDDLVIHPTERELVIGTHGRGIWVMDVSPLEQLTEEVLKADAHLFRVKPAYLLKPAPRPAAPPTGFKAPNPSAGIPVHFLTTAKTAGKTEVVCTDASGKRVGLYLGRDMPGLDRCTFDVKGPGEYTVTLTSGGVTQTEKVTVKEVAPEKPEGD